MTSRGRHRGASRPSTPLDVMASSLASSFQSSYGRSAVVAVASSGLVLGVSATATAAPAGDVIAPPVLKSTSLTAVQIERAATQARVVVDAGTEVGFAAATVTAEAAPPPPPPPVRTVTSRTRTAPAVERENRDEEATEAESSQEAPVEEAAPEQAAPPIDGSVADQILAIARQHIGTPYVSGGSKPGGFDCSGFTQWVYAQVGISLPRTSGAQGHVGTRVSAADARPGDLVWWSGHVGIYTGNGNHIAARNPSKPLAESVMYRSNPVYIRVIG